MSHQLSRQKLFIAAFAAFSLAGVPAVAQTANAGAEAEIRTVMQEYMRVSSTGDEKGGRALFHPNAVMSGAMVGNKINITTPESFFGHLARVAAAPKAPYGPAKILYATVNGEVGTGAVDESDFGGVHYTDQFQFVHENGKWLIISKIWTGVKNNP